MFLIIWFLFSLFNFTSIILFRVFNEDFEEFWNEDDDHLLPLKLILLIIVTFSGPLMASFVFVAAFCYLFLKFSDFLTNNIRKFLKNIAKDI